MPEPVMPNFSYQWRKPQNVACATPTIWKTFEIQKASRSNSTVKIQIRDVPDDRIEDVINFMTTNFLRDEPLAKFAGVSEDPISIKSHRCLWREVLKCQMSIVAFVIDGSEKPQIAAVELFTVSSAKDPKFPEFPGEAMRRKRNVINQLCGEFDLHQLLQANAFLRDMGLCVYPEFRGCGIGRTMLQIIPKMAESVNLNAAVVIFSAAKTQKMAQEANYYVTFNKLKYEDFKDDGYDLEGIKGNDEIWLCGLRLSSPTK